VARGAVFGRPEDMEQALKACETEDGVLALAINKELDAILYLNEMKSLVQTEEALKALDIIIAEERSHVTDLATHRDELMSQT
jgi:rubrerythrin